MKQEWKHYSVIGAILLVLLWGYFEFRYNTCVNDMSATLGKPVSESMLHGAKMFCRDLWKLF
jgi:hypothetical protein